MVALETSVIGQGLPVPENRECIERMNAAVRASGAVPAWIGVVDGTVTVGLSDEQLARFAEPGVATKVARRDVPVAVASGALGATTVSATVWAAAKAGIEVAATGGIGGVHPGRDPDVSADLLELARTPGLLVCSGPKSIIDPAATAEKLEELGVALVGYGVGRLPFFLARETSVELEHRVDTPGRGRGDRSGGVRPAGGRRPCCSAIRFPKPRRWTPVTWPRRSRKPRLEPNETGVHGKERTPFLLTALAEITGGRSLRANLALLEDNARVAGLVAASLAAR